MQSRKEVMLHIANHIALSGQRHRGARQMIGNINPSQRDIQNRRISGVASQILNSRQRRAKALGMARKHPHLSAMLVKRICHVRADKAAPADQERLHCGAVSRAWRTVSATSWISSSVSSGWSG